jgi:hypothetical protein
MTPATSAHSQHHTWIGRHKVWTTVLVVLALAVVTGAILCNIF